MNNETVRPKWNDYFAEIVKVTAKRSACNRDIMDIYQDVHMNKKLEMGMKWLLYMLNKTQ
jgi:hypothetical protein